jgi:threonine/homoserine/homoserine lactone efflux protein
MIHFDLPILLFLPELPGTGTAEFSGFVHLLAVIRHRGVASAMPVLSQLLILGVTYLVVDGAILLVWGWLGVRAATTLKWFSFGLVNKVSGALMIGAAALLTSKDFQPKQ